MVFLWYSQNVIDIFLVQIPNSTLKIWSRSAYNFFSCLDTRAHARAHTNTKDNRRITFVVESNYTAR